MNVHSVRTNSTDQGMNTVEMISLEVWPESNMSCRTACWGWNYSAGTNPCDKMNKSSPGTVPAVV
jgi:hypothetical protein